MTHYRLSRTVWSQCKHEDIHKSMWRMNVVCLNRILLGTDKRSIVLEKPGVNGSVDYLANDFSECECDSHKDNVGTW